MEIASQTRKYPTIYYDSENDVVMLTSKGFALFSVIRNALEETKKLYFFPRRLERMLYEFAAKSKDANNFWDKTQTLINLSDPLSSFLLFHLVSIATRKFGPLGSFCSEDAIQWTTTISVSGNGRYSKRFRLLKIYSGDPEFHKSLLFIRMNPVFVKNDVEKNWIVDREKIVLLQNLKIIAFNHERQMYNLTLPLIYPWNLNCCAVELRVTEDYCKRIYRDYELRLENPMSKTDISNLILNLLRVGRKTNVKSLWDVFSMLKDFSNNVVSLIYRQDQNSSYTFSMEVFLPFSLEDPSVFGRILWALNDIPKVVGCMPFDWFRTVLVQAIRTSRLLGIRTGIPDLSEDASIFLTSPSVAEVISIVARNFGMLPRTEHHEYGKTLKFNSKRDLKRIGLISKMGIAEDDEKMSHAGFVFEILNEVMRIRPEHSILLGDLAARLEVDPNFLLNFIRRNLSNSLDLSIPGEISPLNDPWLEL